MSRVIIAESPTPETLYYASPALTRMDSGSLIVAHDQHGPSAPTDAVSGGYNRTSIYRSADNGATWAKRADIDGLFWSTMFSIGGMLYGFGPQFLHGPVVLWSSIDEGTTWSGPVSLWEQGAYGGICAGGQTPALIDGTLYLCFGVSTAGYGSPESLNIASVPVAADLTEATNWTVTTHVPPAQQLPESWKGAGWDSSFGHQWTEHAPVEWPSGQLAVVSRVQSEPQIVGHAAVHSIDRDTLNITKSVKTRLNGGDKKMCVFTDNGRLFVLANENPYNAQFENRNARTVLTLYSTGDGQRWLRHKRLIGDVTLDPYQFGFQYPDSEIDGNDMIVAVREADANADDSHNANLLTFYRLPDWRDGWQSLGLQQ